MGDDSGVEDEDLEEALRGIARALTAVRKNQEVVAEILDPEDFHEKGYNRVIKSLETMINNTAKAESKARLLQSQLK